MLKNTKSEKKKLLQQKNDKFVVKNFFNAQTENN
jgi:hypothetical protein